PPAGRASLPVADGQVIAEVPQRAAYLLGHVLVADALEAGVGQLQGAGGGVPPHLPVEADLLGEGLGVIAAGLEVGVDLPVGDLLVGDLPRRRPHVVVGGRQLVAVDTNCHDGAAIAIEGRLEIRREACHFRVEGELTARRPVRGRGNLHGDVAARGRCEPATVAGQADICPADRPHPVLLVPWRSPGEVGGAWTPRDRAHVRQRRAPRRAARNGVEGLFGGEGQAAGTARAASSLTLSGRNPDQWSCPVTTTGAWA